MRAHLLAITTSALAIGGQLPLPLFSDTAQAASFGNAYFLGDSLSDCCVLGRYTQNNLPNYTDLLPGLIGASYSASVTRNSAVGGAQSGNNNLLQIVDTNLSRPTGLLSQLALFQTSGMTFGPRDLAGIWIGTNDIAAAAAGGPMLSPGLFYNKPLGTRPDVNALASFVSGNVRTTITTLAQQGLRNVLLQTPIDLTQSISTLNPGDNVAPQLAGQYSLAVRNQLANLYTPGVNTYFLDTYSLVKEAQAAPSRYGLTHTTPFDDCVASNCASMPIAQQNQYMFNDTVHFTGAFQQVIAEYAANIINARDGLATQGDLGQAVGLAFSDALFNRLDAYRRFDTPRTVPAPIVELGDQHEPSLIAPASRSNPFSLFADGMYAGYDRNANATANGPTNSASNADFAGVTAGVEYRPAPNLLFGAAFNYLNTQVGPRGLSLTRYDFDTYQGGAFASYNTSNLFVDGAMTYGANKYSLRRPGVVDMITAAPSGNTFTTAGKIGYLFDYARLRVGPIADLTYANTQVGGYQESGDPVLTLGVRNQNFGGLTGGAGFQVRTNLSMLGGSVSPFLNVTAEHDYLDGLRTVTSFGTDAPALLINTQAGVRSDNVYGKLAGGFDLEIGNGLNGFVSGGLTVGRSYGNDYGASGGLRYTF